MRTIWPLLYHSNLLLLFSSFFIHSGFAKICSVSFTYLSQNRIQSFYILQKSNRVPLLYLVTLPHYLGITQVYFLFFDIFPPSYGIITVTVRQNPSQQLLYIFTPKQVLCQSEIYLFLSARLFTFSFCCMFSTVLQQHMFGCSLKAFSLMAYRLFLFFTFCHILLDIYRYIWYNSYI